MSEPNWDNFENFTREEFVCKCGCGRADMDAEFMRRLQILRTYLGFPFKINSGFRCKSHYAERGKVNPGEHTLGKAADVAVSGAQARSILSAAHDKLFPRIGVKQHGPTDGRYIHLGTATEEDRKVSPTAWTY